MKNTNALNIVVFSLFISCGIYILCSCSSNNSSQPQTQDSSQTAAKENNAKFANKKEENDAQFLVSAAAFSLEEINLGKLAQQKGGSGNITALGAMMVEQHNKSFKEIAKLSKSQQVTIPDSATSESANIYKQLADKSGNDFNKAYCERVITQHKDIIAKFEKEAADSRNQDIKEWATTALPMLRKHLDKVFDCQKQIEKI